jgi:hypothetical protein
MSFSIYLPAKSFKGTHNNTTIKWVVDKLMIRKNNKLLSIY